MKPIKVTENVLAALRDVKENHTIKEAAKPHTPNTVQPSHTNEMLNRIKINKTMGAGSRVVEKEFRNHQAYLALPEWVKCLSPTKNVEALKVLASLHKH